MARSKFLFAIFLAEICSTFTAPKSWANDPSYRVAHPAAWLHQLPVGEKPGWSSDVWFNFELSQSNVWNNQADFVHTSTGQTLSLGADFEQTSAIIETGVALTDQFALALEVPYSIRGPGFLDNFIDQFHALIGADRFLRPETPAYQNTYRLETNGTDQFRGYADRGISSVKLKAKNWLWKYLGSPTGVCECGFSTQVQVKVPLGNVRGGLSSGDYDYSLVAHLGAPIFSASAIWFTAATTKLGQNALYIDWPRRTWSQMYELSAELALGGNWAAVLQIRMESPLMNKEELRVVQTKPDPVEQFRLQTASAWNGMVHWRGSEAFGLRWRGKTSQLRILLIEDFAIGDQDSRREGLYMNNAPDVAFVSQLHFNF